GINTRIDRRRVEAIRRGASRYLLGWDQGAAVQVWAGMRPMLPDGLPAIGRAPGYENLYVAAGHAMLGVTLGPVTAAAVAALMTSGRSDWDLRPFDPGRFDRRVRRSIRSCAGAPAGADGEDS
ncbi:MAG TPA: FAD-binding oxidoreductase, partial [Bacillota bacterium]